jgi:hypothetical protein
MLESETILGPYRKVDLTDDFDSVNDFPWPRGMPANWLATGMGGPYGGQNVDGGIR